MARTYVIADIGACHEGRLGDMQAAVWAAKGAGCNAIKFQWTSNPRRMAQRRGRAEADGYADIYARYLAWPREWLVVLHDACRAAGIDFMCTAFLPEDVAVVAPHVRHYKIASFEASDPAMYAAHDALPPEPIGSEKLIIASFGMGARMSLDVGDGGGRTLRRLHCVSSYPAPIKSLNLLACRDLRISGFSDHSAPHLTFTGALAVAAGASIVEAHLKLPGTAKDNPDGPHAMTQVQFAEYVTNIRIAEECLGDGVRTLQPCEEQMAQYRVTEQSACRA